jgi:hypothetical protein
VQALRRLARRARQPLEPHRRVDEFPQRHARRFRLAVEEEVGCLVQERPGEGRIAADSIGNGAPDTTCHCHNRHFPFRPVGRGGPPVPGDWRRTRILYSWHSFIARAMSDCWRRLVPPVNGMTSVGPSWAR